MQYSMAAVSCIISKEGFLYKKGGVIKSWSRRYFVLSPQSLCYFRSEAHEKLEPLGRIFLSDIVSISTESTEKKKAFVFVLQTKKRAVLLQGANHEDRDKWVHSIKTAAEIDKEAENKDPFRKSLRRLTPGIKRITLFKDPTKGIGCTIKNAAGHIFVNRILEDGPIAETGVLRPGDEILDMHGVPVFNKTIAEVVDIIKQSPIEFLATVRPIASVQKALRNDFRRINYSSIMHKPVGNDKIYDSIEVNDTNTSNNGCYDYATVSKPIATRNGRVESPTKQVLNDSPSQSLEDVGNYDDEDEGDVPPPLPAWTEDALILVDPPPLQTAEPKFNIYNTNAHLLPIGDNRKYPGTPDRNIFRKKKTSQQEFRSPYHSNSSSPRRCPPNFPPPRPGKLQKCRSQDALDSIDSKPPVPPRLKRPEQGYRSPGSRPRNGHLYNESTFDSRVPRRVKNQLYEDVDNTKYADLTFSKSYVYTDQ